MRENVIKEKSLRFAIRIVKLYKHLVKTEKEFLLSKQILRSGTSIGAMIREAEHAESAADFIHKMSIALKEANETEYWLILLKEADFLSEVAHKSLQTDIEEILRILTAILKTKKNN